MLDHGTGQKLLVKKALHIQMTPWKEHFNRDEGLEVPECWTTVIKPWQIMLETSCIMLCQQFLEMQLSHSCYAQLCKGNQPLFSDPKHACLTIKWYSGDELVYSKLASEAENA